MDDDPYWPDDMTPVDAGAIMWCPPVWRSLRDSILCTPWQSPTTPTSRERADDPDE